MSHLEYFANKEPDELVGELYGRIENYFHVLEQTGHLYKIRKSFEIFYNINTNADRVREAGEQGELLRVTINQYKSILSQIHTLVTKERPALKSQAINSDHKSQAQAQLADGLLDYYLKTKDIEQVLKDGAELGLNLSAAFIVLRWNVLKGREFASDPETNSIVYEGDIEASAKSPLDVIYDLSAESPQWYITIEYRNKYDLAAQYPEKADEIIGLSRKQFDDRRLVGSYFGNDDLVPVYIFQHELSPAVTEGRQFEFLDSNIWLSDGALPYREVPIIPVMPGRIKGTGLGDTPAFSLLAIQEMIDELYSAVITNQSTFAVSNIMVPKGADIEVSQLAGGVNLIEYEQSQGKPEALNLTFTPREVFESISMLEQRLQILSGVNDVIRGVAPDQLRSGNALALLASQALSAQSGLNNSYNKLLERVGTMIIHMLQDYAKTPRIAMISGIANRSFLEEFRADDISSIERVVVEQQSALMRTTAGRMELAEKLLQAKLFKRPEEYLSVVQTGQLQGLLQTEQSTLMLIRQENEALRKGEEVIVIDTDTHDLHVRAHREVLDDPEMRKNPIVVKATLDHIQDHIEALETGDPRLFAIIKEQPLQPLQIPAGASPEGTLPIDGTVEEADMPGMPDLPENSPAAAEDALAGGVA